MNFSLFNHSFIHFALVYLLSIFSVLATVMHTGYSVMIKARSLPVTGICTSDSDGLVKKQLLNLSYFLLPNPVVFK